ncbi:MAG: arginine repressor [Lawsonibacter sp.]
MKRARQTEILNIIQSVDVETQEQLLDELRARGYSATQATISRDIKELRLVKELAGGGYRYASSDRRGLADSDIRLRNIFKEGVTSVDVAQNIVVVRDYAGAGLGGLFGPGQYGHHRAWWPVWRGMMLGF